MFPLGNISYTLLYGKLQVGEKLGMCLKNKLKLQEYSSTFSMSIHFALIFQS